MNTSDVEKMTDLDEQNLDFEGNNNKQSTTLDKEKDIRQNFRTSPYFIMHPYISGALLFSVTRCAEIFPVISQLNSCVKYPDFVNRQTRTYFRQPVHEDITEFWFALRMELHVLTRRHIKFS